MRPGPVRPQAEWMWLVLEKSGVRNQRRELGVEDLHDPHPELPARRPLVLTAAHTLLPEAGTDVLPELARREVEDGLTGPLRTALARCEDDSPAVEDLRDRLVAQLGGGRPGPVAAVAVADQVHLRRLVRGVVPAVIATGNLLWYDGYRQDSAPHVEAVAALRGLYAAWKRQPGQRRVVEDEMRRVAVGVVGADPDDLLDVVV
jgi:hypothetical protein